MPKEAQDINETCFYLCTFCVLIFIPAYFTSCAINRSEVACNECWRRGNIGKGSKAYKSRQQILALKPLIIVLKPLILF